ncbi:GNAT family N-acetyltransferase [Bacteroidota bacterium]
MVKIREERIEDFEAVREINNNAFGQPEEGRIVDKIREACEEIISLVAVEGEKVLGHIFFSPAVINYNGKKIKGMGLAPMAVHPDYQNKGIGTLLVNEGIKKVKETGCLFIIVLGHDKYYPRFGFETASIYGIKPQWKGVPDEAFMIMILDKEKMTGVSGVATYRKEFDEAM